MAAVYELKYRDGRSEEHWAVHDFYYYILPSQQLLRVQLVPAWCHTCDDTTQVEYLLPLKEVEEQLGILRDAELRKQHRSFRNMSAEQLAPAELRFEKKKLLVSNRISPPRCFSCGKTKVTFFEHRQWVPHPKTKEEVFLDLRGVGTTTALPTRFFDLNGNEMKISKAEWNHYRTLIKAGEY